ncbi:chloride intracellular channel protein 5-like [Saccoglossus kowalevskii]|uniref:Chloride intracellular channel protein 5-like n=1 Tax=Saccoglossus kowalevskii TaxID=10224 RepID=A0ABM0MSG6_SACKO|nr:PREDICTED: chloride intracellular channel protein 5-like [Saccoglossus kowalevskii]
MGDMNNSNESIELFVRAGRDGKSLGDCPFSQRIFLILCLKKVSFNITTVDMNKKPKRFMDISPGGKIPVLVDGDRVLTDVSEMADYLEQTIPEPSLRSTNKKAMLAGIDVFQKFSRFIKNEDPQKDEILRKGLIKELLSLDSFLKSDNSPGCFLDGDTMTQLDCNMLPKLHHIRVASKRFKEFDIPEDFEGLRTYLNAAYATEEFKDTLYPDDEVVHGWNKHLGRV